MQPVANEQLFCFTVWVLQYSEKSFNGAKQKTNIANFE